jgi:hypothetical protein
LNRADGLKTTLMQQYQSQKQPDDDQQITYQVQSQRINIIGLILQTEIAILERTTSQERGIAEIFNGPNLRIVIFDPEDNADRILPVELNSIIPPKRIKRLKPGTLT